MNPYQAYFLGLVTLPIIFAILRFSIEITGRAKGWWRRRHAQVSFTIRCERCGRTFSSWTKRRVRAFFGEHECALREFVPTGELIPEKEGSNR